MTAKELLEAWKLDQYWSKLEDEGYDDPEDWPSVTQEDLIKIGIKRGHALRFVERVKKQFEQEKEEKKEENKQENKQENKPENDKKKILKKKKVSLLFVGETGVGKSTLLASFADFINGVKFGDVKCTEKIGDKGESQTKISSQFHLSNNEWAVNIIDTPGIGDTEGFETDQKHLDNIIKHVGQFGDFNAVCILIKRGTTRATTRVKYIIGELKSHMPKDVQDNFIVIMTRSDVPIPDKDTLDVIKKLRLPIDNIIPINNCAYEELDLSNYKSDSAIVKSLKQRQETDYYVNHKNLEILLDLGAKMKPYQGNKILSLKIKRDKLKEEVGLLKIKIDNSFKIDKDINEKLIALDSAKNIKELNKAYDQSKQIPRFTYYKEHGKITTHCNACSKACHIDCGLSYGDDLNSCACAGSNGVCSSCDHLMSSHTHLGWKTKTHFEHIKCINDNMKLKWENAKEREQMIKRQMRAMKQKLSSLEKERQEYVKSIQLKYQELKKIAIVGYNEDFGTYINECLKSVKDDRKLSKKDKEKKIGIFKAAWNTFSLMVDVLKDNLKDASSYAN